MQFFPNSYGTTRSAIREHNDCNLPAGAPESKGGQFGKKGECGGSAGPQSTGEQPRQPGLQDVKSGEEKFHRPQRPQGLHQETPEETVKKKGRPTGEAGTVSVSDNGGTEEALQALGIDLTPDEIAAAMVSHLPGDWSVTVSGQGGAEPEYDEGPDPDDERDTYQEWADEQYSEASTEAYDEEATGYRNRSAQSYDEVGQMVNGLLGARQTETSEAAAVEHTRALAELIFNHENSGDDIINTEGFMERGAQGKVSGIVEAYLADNPDATFDHFDIGMFDDFDRLEWSRYFNGHDGRDNWIEDGHEQSALDNADVDSFDTRYENQYGTLPGSLW